MKRQESRYSSATKTSRSVTKVSKRIYIRYSQWELSSGRACCEHLSNMQESSYISALEASAQSREFRARKAHTYCAMPLSHNLIYAPSTCASIYNLSATIATISPSLRTFDQEDNIRSWQYWAPFCATSLDTKLPQSCPLGFAWQGVSGNILDFGGHNSARLIKYVRSIDPPPLQGTNIPLSGILSPKSASIHHV